MQILAIEKELVPFGPEHKALLSDEAAHVWELKKQGMIRDIWFTVHDHVAVLLLECASEQEAIDRLNEFPLVKAGAISFHVMPLKTYDGFDRLFGNKKEDNS